MNAVVISAQGSPVAPNIRAVRDWADLPATPQPGSVHLRTLASALNHMDIWVGAGIPGVDLTYPRVSGCDCCAEVVAVGPGVAPEWLGTRVIVNAAYFKQRPARPADPPASSYIPDIELIGEHIDGMHRQIFSAPVENIALVGPDADPVEAAAFGLVSLTAYSMMATKADLRPGQSVLITGIGGGVATAALAIAKWLACPVVVTSRHQWKLDRARALGADHCVLDTGQDWSKDVRAWSGRRGVDLAVDTVGKPTHLHALKSLARGGAYVTAGNTAGPVADTNIAIIFWNQLRILGSTMGSNPEMRELAALFRAGKLRPVVDSVFPWSEAPRAWEKLEAAEQFGKLVLDWR
ncbi:MAG: zinc-binding dehydrogenase [Planctomycetota bacterium]|nr:zinc-binding dehydrogenase [Planctomycetota bacterium]